MKLHGKEIKVGDIVWSTSEGYARVSEIYNDPHCAFPIVVEGDSYTPDGRYGLNDIGPSLYWVEPEIVVPEEKVVYINIYPRSTHESRDAADYNALHYRVACIKVEYRDGQYDD